MRNDYMYKIVEKTNNGIFGGVQDVFDRSFFFLTLFKLRLEVAERSSNVGS